MKTKIALLRGINVGGKHILPMKELVGILEGLGCQDVKTYIQSGNVVFQTDEGNLSRLSAQIQEAIKKRKGFEAQALVLAREQLEKAIHENPFPEATTDPGPCT